MPEVFQFDFRGSYGFRGTFFLVEFKARSVYDNGVYD
jgi:hypothetical protein